MTFALIHLLLLSLQFYMMLGMNNAAYGIYDNSVSTYHVSMHRITFQSSTMYYMCNLPLLLYQLTHLAGYVDKIFCKIKNYFKTLRITYYKLIFK